MSKLSLKRPSDQPARVRVSTVILALAGLLAILAPFVARGFNGLSLVAVILLMGAFALRLLEGNRA